MKKLLLSSLITLMSIAAFSQSDSLILVNGNVIVGELKSMDKGVAIVETDYSDADFKIEWDGIKELYTESSYMVTFSNGNRINGKIVTSGDNLVKVIPETGTVVETKP